MAIAIDVQAVSKRFNLAAGRVTSLKERVVHPRRSTSTRDFWALRDVSFELGEGDTLGLLGHNGSGKSTLLKLVGGIMQPTTGFIRVRGRVASLLELGAGMHPELTGRENVFLNGSILGLSKKELRRRFDDIVAFAELEEFIDQQVRNYSSGMFVRLAFSVAVNVEPDVLLVDEVLAVGDENFQRKCMDRVKVFQAEGRTIVVVSHSAEQIRRICDRVIVLDHGQLVADDVPAMGIRVFREHMLEDQLERRAKDEARRAEETRAAAADAAPASADETTPGMPPSATPWQARGATNEAQRTFQVRITSVTLQHPHSAERSYLLTGEPLSIRVGYEAAPGVRDVVFGIGVFDNRDGIELFGTNTEVLGVELDVGAGSGEVVFEIDQVQLLDGNYPLTIGVHSGDVGEIYDWSEQRHYIEVVSPLRHAGRVALPTRVHAASSIAEGVP